MKKFFAILLCAVVAIASFTACKPHEHTKSAWKYSKAEHWRIPECNRDDCAVEDIVYDFGVHIDEDEDNLCDVCGYAMLKHEHTYNYVSEGEVGHYKNFTCGCPSEEGTTPHNDENSDFFCDECGDYMFRLNVDVDWQYSETHHWWTPDSNSGDMIGVVYGFGEHENMDADMFCDICGYHMADIPTPTNYFLRNQAGCEWLNEITAEDIAEIKMISGGGGPLPPVSFTHISSSRNKAVISNIFEEYYWLDSAPVSEEETQIADGGYFIVQFILNNGEVKKLNFINGDFYHDGNGNYFELVRLPVFRDGTDFVNHYGLETWEKYCPVYLVDETFVCEIPVSEFEFMGLIDDICLDDTAPTHYVEMNGERLYFILNSYFYIDDDRSVYYQLVGENLLTIIEEYSQTTL